MLFIPLLNKATQMEAFVLYVVTDQLLCWKVEKRTGRNFVHCQLNFSDKLSTCAECSVD